MTYVSHHIPDDADYAYVRERLHARVDADRASGGDRARLTGFHERLMTAHDTSTCSRGEPCDECGRPWPCGTVLGILGHE